MKALLLKNGHQTWSLEILAIAGIFLFNELVGFGIRYSSQVALVISLILITFFLKKRHLTWADLGLRFPQNWLKAILLFILCVATIGLTFNFVIQPLFPSGANDINQGFTLTLSEMLFQLVVIGIGTAAIGEELLFRGYLLNTINQLIGKNSIGTILAILLQALFFAILHSGVQGMISAGIIGIILGVFYILSDRNLLVVMAAHAVPDALSIIGSYQNQ